MRAQIGNMKKVLLYVAFFAALGMTAGSCSSSTKIVKKAMKTLNKRPAYVSDAPVSRNNAGNTNLEKTIIRWYFESAPKGARLFWRVVSSVPDQVKNTNETFLGSTPYEETRSFNIIGLTYANSRDITVEIKVKKPGYIDQVKRFNVRQAIDQQEISSFFDLIKEDE